MLTQVQSIPLLCLLLSSSVEGYQQSNAVNNAKGNRHSWSKSTSGQSPVAPSPLLPSQRGNSPNPNSIRSLLSVSSSTVTAPRTASWPQPILLDRPFLNGEQHQIEGDWIDGDLFLPSHLHDDDSPHALPTYVEKLRRRVEETSLAIKVTSEEEQETERQEEHIEPQTPQEAAKEKKLQKLSHIDLSLFATYFCNAVAMTVPVVLMPLVAAERVAGTKMSSAAVVATFACVSTLGTGLGKVLNGLVCQKIGGKRTASTYMLGLTATMLSLSVTPASGAGVLLALNEFFASIQWAACSVVFSNHYKEPAKFAKGMTLLSLSATSGMIAAKVGGTAFLKVVPSWRALAQVGGLIALVGATVARTQVTEHPVKEKKTASSSVASVDNQKKSEKHGPFKAFKTVLSSPLFWQVGIAHSTAMLARTSDRILGSFFHQTTYLPRSICGGLTAFVTLGFVHGLIKGRSFHHLPNIRTKTQMISRNYALSALTAVALAACSNSWVQATFFPSKTLLAAVVAAMTGFLASNVSFQFYQIPAMTATTFGKNKAVALSLFDGLGFLFAAPVWALTGRIVAAAGEHGWSLAWLMLASMFGAGGKTMLNVLPSVLMKQQQQQRRLKREKEA